MKKMFVYRVLIKASGMATEQINRQAEGRSQFFFPVTSNDSSAIFKGAQV
jgi:hypothetical protein